MAFSPFRRDATSMRAYVIRVIDSRGASGPVSRFAVLARNSGEAMAAVLACIGLCDVAEITDEVLSPVATTNLGLTPGRPARLS